MKPRIHRQPKSRQWLWSGPSSVAIAGMLVTAAIVTPARAATLHAWAFDPDTRQFTVTLPDGVTPNYFLLAKPARIVLDLPDTALGTIPLEQEYSGAIRSIRFSEIQGGSRVVIELAPATQLDPNHAELTSSAVNNGQTLWTLQPLIQDGEIIAPIAVADPSPQSSDTPPSSAPTSSATTFEPTTPPSLPIETVPDLAEPEPLPGPTDEEAMPELAPSDSIASEDGQAAAESEAEPEEPSEAIQVTPSSAEAPDTELAEPDAAQHPLPGRPVTESSDAASPTLAPSPLPDIARSATTGAAQALPSGPDPLREARTDAAALAGVGSEATSDLPPTQLPSGSLPTAAQPMVSVPPLGDRSSSPPQVSVPPLADVPAPQTPDSPPQEAAAEAAVTIPVPAVPEPESEAATLTEPAVSSPPAPPSTTTATSETPVSSGTAPQTIRPPQSEVTASVPAPPVEEPLFLPEADTSTPTNPNTAASASVVPPRPPEIGTAALPPEAEPSSTTANTVAVPETPPFLSSTGNNATNAEPLPIPSPPSSAPNGNVVTFGAPLPPQDKAIDGADAAPSFQNSGTIPTGTQLVLQYPGTEPLTLNQQEPWYEVLVVAEDVFHPNTNEQLLIKGTQVIGRFEGFDHNGRRFVGQVFVEENGDRRPLLAESDWLEGIPQPSRNNLLTNSGIGAAALAVLSGFSGIGLIGGAALGAASSYATAPHIVTIEPGQLITVEVVSDGEPFNEAASITP